MTADYLRLRQICLVAPHLADAERVIADVLGLTVCYRDPNVGKYGLENALWPVGDMFLEVVAPTKPETQPPAASCSALPVAAATW